MIPVTKGSFGCLQHRKYKDAGRTAANEAAENNINFNLNLV
jgi:hypothetical protein